MYNVQGTRSLDTTFGPNIDASSRWFRVVRNTYAWLCDGEYEFGPLMALLLAQQQFVCPMAGPKDGYWISGS